MGVAWEGERADIKHIPYDDTSLNILKLVYNHARAGKHLAIA